MIKKGVASEGKRVRIGIKGSIAEETSLDGAPPPPLDVLSTAAGGGQQIRMGSFVRGEYHGTICSFDEDRLMIVWVAKCRFGWSAGDLGGTLYNAEVTMIPGSAETRPIQLCQGAIYAQSGASGFDVLGASTCARYLASGVHSD
jgi:hypothetical protein